MMRRLYRQERIKSRLQAGRQMMLLLLAVAATFLSASSASPSERKSKKGAVNEEPSEFAKPELLSADTGNPTLRYPIASFSGWSVFSTSYGWFDVSRSGIRYTVIQPPGKVNEGFEATSAELSEIVPYHVYLRFKTGNKKRMIFYLPEEQWGAVHSGPGAMAAASRGGVGTSSIMQAMKNFDRVLAMVKPPPPPAPEVALSANSASIERGQTVTLTWSSQNAISLRIEPGVGSVEAAGSRTVTPEAATTYTITAQGAGGTKAASAHVEVTLPTPPTVVLIEPSVAASGQTFEVTQPAFKVRGVAMDHAGIPVVSINGTPASMRPQNAQAAEFWSDALTLHEGENRFEVVATNHAQAQAKMVFVAKYTPPSQAPPPAPVPEVNSKAFTKQGILDLLGNFVPSARVTELVRQYGLRFTPTPDDLREMRAAGGKDDLVDAVLQAGKDRK